MSILELAEQYLDTTRPSEAKKQGNLVDIMIKIRIYMDLQERNKKVADKRWKK